ncbi:MAG: hypothetical protein KME05_23980 [Gloeocapsa sp. UFS-A4-WI-NPMV-4B04]|jgi:hypothetical protein|nr:hypothetical protein [Gloeocapsa sp. UFS-A4-WI-NPMV-4B04]
MMLLLVLCSVSVSVVNLKLNNLNPFQKWWVSAYRYVAVFLASNYYCSNSGKALTKAMLLLAACLKRSVSCLRAAIVVNFYQEIFLAQCEFLTSKAKTSTTDCFKNWTPATTHPALGTTPFHLETVVS